MNLSGLDFDNIPSFKVPLRFFLFAPLFALLSAAIIFFAGEALWLSRWSPSTLALTHSIVLGFISMVMCGAVLQLLPVLAGVSFPYSERFGGITAIALALSSAVLVAGFYFSNYVFLKWALFGFMLTFTGFIGIILYLVKHRIQGSFSINTMRLSFVAVLVVVVIATLMLADYLWGGQFNVMKQLTDNHANWGLVGWVSLMIIGVSFQVLPMFHVAPAFPVWSSRFLPAILFSLLTLQLLGSVLPHLTSWGSNDIVAVFEQISVVLLKLSLLSYAFIAFWSLHKRKRKITDVSVTLWMIALTSLSVCTMVSLLPTSAAIFADWGWSPLTLASVFIFGWIMSVIMAMLIKIVPFLAYLHLQRQCGFNMQAFTLLPNMHEILSKQRMQYLLYCHCASLFTLMLTLVSTQWYWLLSLALVIQFSYLLLLLCNMSKHYNNLSQKMTILMAE